MEVACLKRFDFEPSNTTSPWQMPAVTASKEAEPPRTASVLLKETKGLWEVDQIEWEAEGPKKI